MSDDEVFGLAVHYYDEDNIKVSKQTNYKVSTGNAKKKRLQNNRKLKSRILPLISVKGRKQKYHQDNFYYLMSYETKN